MVDTVASNHFLYVSDPACRNVYIFNHQGVFEGPLDWTGSGVGTPIPRGVAEDAAGNIYVAEYNSRRIFVFNPTHAEDHRLERRPERPARRARDRARPDQPPDLRRRCRAESRLRVLLRPGHHRQRHRPGQHRGAVRERVAEHRRHQLCRSTTRPSTRSGSPAVDGQGNVYTGDTWGCPPTPPCTSTHPYRIRLPRRASSRPTTRPPCPAAIRRKRHRADHLCRRDPPDTLVGRPRAAAAGRVQPAERDSGCPQ